MVSRAAEVVLLTFVGLGLTVIGVNYLLPLISTTNEVSGLVQLYEEINGIVATYEKGVGVINPVNSIVIYNETEVITFVDVKVEDPGAGIVIDRRFSVRHPALYLIKQDFTAGVDGFVRVVSGGNVSASRGDDVRFIVLSEVSSEGLRAVLIPRIVIVGDLKPHFGREAYNIVIQIPRFIVYSGGAAPVEEVRTGSGGSIWVESVEMEAAPPITWFGSCVQVEARMVVGGLDALIRPFKLFPGGSMLCLDEQVVVLLNISYKYYVLTVS